MKYDLNKKLFWYGKRERKGESFRRSFRETRVKWWTKRHCFGLEECFLWHHPLGCLLKCTWSWSYFYSESIAARAQQPAGSQSLSYSSIIIRNKPPKGRLCCLVGGCTFPSILKSIKLQHTLFCEFFMRNSWKKKFDMPIYIKLLTTTTNIRVLLHIWFEMRKKN